MRSWITVPALALFTLTLAVSSAPSLTDFSSRGPLPPGGVKDDLRKGDPPVLHELDIESHDVNAVFLFVSNRGPIGLDMRYATGSGFFPSNTSNNYVFGTGLWLGAQYDADGDSVPDKVFTQGYNPLAGDSEFREGRGDQLPDDPLTRIFDSTEPADLAEWPPQFSDPGSGDPMVYSDQDLVTTYTTQDQPPVCGEFQHPIEVNQRSMAVGTTGRRALVVVSVSGEQTPQPLVSFSPFLSQLPPMRHDQPAAVHPVAAWDGSQVKQVPPGCMAPFL